MTQKGSRAAGGRAIRLRDARIEDVDLAYRITEATMRDYVLSSLGAWSEPAVRRRLSDDIASGSVQIIEIDHEPAGLFSVLRFETHFEIDHLYLSPPFQNAGVGAVLLDRLLDEARERGVPVRLRVLRTNPAKRFYERHGFVVVHTTAERFFLEHAATAETR